MVRSNATNFDPFISFGVRFRLMHYRYAPWKQASVRAVFRLVSICALMSEPQSSSSRTAAVWPFIAASIRGEIPSFEPVREFISAWKQITTHV